MDTSGLRFERFSRRENDILALLGENLHDREIAERLVLSLHSVKWYTRQIYGKLGVANRREAVAKARELGLLVREPLKRTAHNLPRSLSSFIGREKEIDQVVKMVWEHPLVTLTGAGGVGKTRLAQVVARELLDDFADGVWYVELASLSDPQVLERALAAVLGAREDPARPLLETIGAFFYDRQALLVLDNCEHVIAACASIVVDLLTHLPHLKILATSRETLHVDGEAVFYVPSLTFPAEPGALAQVDNLEFEAVRLFVERARAGFPDFKLTPISTPAVEEVCRRLDGIPLAIELAAARTRMLTVAQIADRLDQAFQLLTGGSRAALPRHQTLRALIDWSYDLLSPLERTLACRLSVFAGGWTIEAAERVCADGSEPDNAVTPDLIQSHRVVDLLGSLVDKSLVQFEPSSPGEPRYRMLETVRQYAREKLKESGAEDRVREHHLDYFLWLGQQAEPHLRAWGARTWMDRLEGELDDLRQALSWALTGSLVKGLQLTVSLWWFWWARHRREAEEWLQTLLTRARDQLDFPALNEDGKAVLGRALNMLLHFRKRGPASAPEWSEQLEKAIYLDSREIFQALGEAYQLDYAIACYYHAQSLEDYLACRERFLAVHDPFWTAECANALSECFKPEEVEAVSYTEENLALRKQIGDLEGQGEALFELGFLALSRGNEKQSIYITLEALDCFEKAGNRWKMAVIHIGFSGFYIQLGNVQEAVRHVNLLEAIVRELNDPRPLIMVQVHRAGIACLEKKFDQAIRYCQKALELSKEYPPEENRIIFYYLFLAHLSHGNLVQAGVYLNVFFTEELFRTQWDIGIHVIQDLGLLSARDGRIYQAVLWFGALDGLFKEHDWLMRHVMTAKQKECDQALAAARAALGDEAFTNAWEAGRALTVEQVIRMAHLIVT